MEILNTIRTLKIIFEGEVELNDEDEFTLPYRIIQCRIKDMDLIEKIGTHRLTVKGYMPRLIEDMDYLMSGRLYFDVKHRNYALNLEEATLLEPKTIEDKVRLLSYDNDEVSKAKMLIMIEPDFISKVLNDNLDTSVFENTPIEKKDIVLFSDVVLRRLTLIKLYNRYKMVLSLKDLNYLAFRKYKNDMIALEEDLENNLYATLMECDLHYFKYKDTKLVKVDCFQRKLLESDKLNEEDLFFKKPLRLSPLRLKYFIKSLIQSNEERKQNTYIYSYELEEEIDKYMPELRESYYQVLLDYPEDFVSKKIFNNTWVVSNKETYDTAKQVYFKLMHALELEKEPELHYYFGDLEKYRYNEQGDFYLSDKQLEVLKALEEKQVILLNGYAGTGKTSTIKALISALESTDEDKKETYSYLLLSPTGKAAKVLSQKTGKEVSTVHKALGISPHRETTKYNRYNPFYQDVIVVDECSFMGIDIFYKLLDAIDFEQSKLLLVADTYQLASISKGNVFYDLLNSNLIKTISLETVRRFNENGIARASTSARKSYEFLDEKSKDYQFLIPEEDFSKPEFYAFKNVEDDKLLDEFIFAYKEALRHYDVDDILVLSALNKGPLGTITINEKIQNLVNPKSPFKRDLMAYNTTYREGDYVLVTRNNYSAKRLITVDKKYNINSENIEYDTFIANGDKGLIVKVYNKGSKQGLVVEFTDYHAEKYYIYFNRDNLVDLSLAYALSIHKSQGSESKMVFFLSPKMHSFMLNSNLIYVAISRSQEKCIHLGSAGVINSRIHTHEEQERDTNLSLFLKNHINAFY